MKNIIDFLIFIPIFLLFNFVSLFDFKTACKIGEVLGYVTMYLGIRKEIAKKNIDLVFKNSKTTDEKEKLLKEFYRNLGIDFISFMFIQQSEKLFRENTKFINKELFNNVLSNKTNCVGITPHFGLMEFVTSYFANEGLKIGVIIKRQKNQFVDKYINKKRSFKNTHIIYKQNALFGALKLMRKGGFVGISPDQDARKKGVFVDFLGLESSFGKGGAILAIKGNIPLLTVGVYVLPEENYRIVVEFLNVIYPDPEVDFDTNVTQITQAIANDFEKLILKHPSKWYWIHKRWKYSSNGKTHYYD